MGMNKIPTLILGIGGIGCRIAAGISDLLSPEDRQHIGIVGMDTNVNDLSKLDSHGIRTIKTSDERTVGDYLKMHPEYTSWFPVNRFTVSRGMLNGAGQIRAISRLAALASEESGAFIPIKEEIKRIRTNRGEGNNGNLTVMVVGSITGGTGAGLFLQMPYYIRKIMKDSDGLDSIIIRGMFVGPDLTADVQPSKINRDAVRVNGYTCLKELNALYMTQALKAGENNLRIDFHKPEDPELTDATINSMRHKAESDDLFFEDDSFDPESFLQDTQTIATGNADIPYDYLYLIEGSTVSGGIGNAALSSVESQVARMVFTLMFTPVKDNALSVEDNMVLQDMDKGGMNRYSSAGLCRLIFPQELAKEYVTLCSVRSQVKDEWLLLDNSFNDQVVEARSRQRTDGQVEIPQLRKSYPALFEREVKGEGKLGRLFKEAFIAQPDHTIISRAASFMKAMEGLVKNVLESDDVVKAQTECELNEENMKKFSDAESEISSVYYALEEYRKLAKRIVIEKEAAIANELFPPSWSSMAHKKDSKVCIYQWLYNVHPLTARYLCYDLMLRLEKRIRELEGRVSGLDLDDYLLEDFDPKEDGIQSADAALRNLREKQIPVLSMIGDESKKLMKLRRKLKDVTETQCELITQYIKLNLELATSQTLLKRVEQLVENYRIFFQSIGNMIEENNDRIAKLEDIRMPLGQIGVYCSKPAFQIMATDYMNSADNTLPTETKTAIFERLFKILADDFENEGKAETERQKERRAAKKAAALGNIFRDAVVDTLRTNVAKNGTGIVDLNIRQALEKQYDLDPGEIADMDLSEDEKLNLFIRRQIENAMRMSAPMLATNASAMAENTETVYMALHPDCAATSMGKPNAGATKELYVPQATEATDGLQATVLMDSAFSPYEITCFKARYKFSIEDLVKYGPDSENARAYKERIRNLGKNPVNTSDPDSFKTVVNPHLDRYWHEEGFIPAMSADERRRSKNNTLKAFIYAMGLDCFKRMIDDEFVDEKGNGRLTWYLDTNRDLIPVKSCGRRIGTGYTDIYKSLPFNGKMKQYILNYAGAVLKNMKGFAEAEELLETILENWLIEDLIQSKDDRNGEEDENILDIILQMRDNMSLEEWKELFTGLQLVLWDICGYLFDENERMVNKAMPEILKKIYQYSRIGDKKVDDLNFTERQARNQIAAMVETKYRR